MIEADKVNVYPVCDVLLVASQSHSLRTRRTIMADSGSPTVKVDGQDVAADAVGSTDLGTGATLAAYERGYELDFPDGTKLWALSMRPS